MQCCDILCILLFPCPCLSLDILCKKCIALRRIETAKLFLLDEAGTDFTGSGWQAYPPESAQRCWDSCDHCSYNTGVDHSWISALKALFVCGFADPLYFRTYFGHPTIASQLNFDFAATIRFSIYIYTYIYIYIYGSIKGLGWTRICIFGEKIVRIGIPIAVSTAVYDCLGAWASAKQAPRCLVQVPQNTFLDNLYCQNLANFYWNCIGMFCSTSWCCEVLVFSFAVIFDTQHLSCTLYKNILWHTRYCMILPFAKFTSTRSEIEWNRCKNGTGWPGMARILDSITSTSRPYASRLTSTFGI
jgi:hypothetical protein